MTTSERILKNTVFLYVKMGITVFISLYTTRLVLNALGASDFGVFGVVGGVITMLGFLNGAMSSATQRYMSYSQGEGDNERQRYIFNNSLILHWGIAIVVGLFLELAALLFFNSILNIEPSRIDAAKWIYHFMVVSTMFTIISVPYDAAINAHENMFYYSIVGILESVLKLVIALYVVYTLYDKLITYGLLMALLSIFLLIIKQAYCQIKYDECKYRISGYVSKKVIRELTGFAGWNFVSTAGTLLGNCGGNVVVNHYFGTSINAAQNVGSQLRGQMMAFSNNMLKALTPVIVKKEGEGDRFAMLKFSLTGSKLSFLMFALLAIPFIVETPFILKVWLKNVPDWTVCFSRFQIVIALMEQLTITLGTTIAATGKIKEISIFSGFARFVPLIIYVFVFSFGGEPYWLYIIILINFGFILNGYTIYQCKKHCNLSMRMFCNSVLYPCCFCSVLSLIIGSIPVVLMEESWMRFIISSCMTLSSYLLAIYYVGFNGEEKIIINSLLRKIFKRFIK